MKGRIIAGTLIALAAIQSAQPLLGAESYNGDAYDLGSGVLLYRESHYRFEADGVAQRLVLYRCPDGRPFARKQLRADGDAQAPDFDMTDARLNYREGVRPHGDQREVYVQRSAETPEQAELVSVPPNGVIDAGFDEFVRRHWDELADGQSLSLPFLVPSRRVFYSFTVKKVEGPQDPTRLTVRLALGAWYAFLLPHIDVVYSRSTQRLLRYEGLSNMRDGEGKSYKVRIEFQAEPAAAASPEQVAAAQAAPLAASCAVVQADTAVPVSGH